MGIAPVDNFGDQAEYRVVASRLLEIFLGANAPGIDLFVIEKFMIIGAKRINVGIDKMMQALILQHLDLTI